MLPLVLVATTVTGTAWLGIQPLWNDPRTDPSVPPWLWPMLTSDSELVRLQESLGPILSPVASRVVVGGTWLLVVSVLKSLSAKQLRMQAPVLPV